MQASIVHELRTPLGCSIQMQEMLGELIDPKLVQSYLEPSVCSNKLMMSLVNDILDVSQIQFGKFTYTF